MCVCLGTFMILIFMLFLFSSEGGSDAESKGRAGNPMVQLFYGRYLAEGINEGSTDFLL